MIIEKDYISSPLIYQGQRIYTPTSAKYIVENITYRRMCQNARAFRISE